MVSCGVLRYLARNLLTLSRSEHFEPSLIIAVLKIPTALSARPFPAGWYGEVVICSIPFAEQNVLNSRDVKVGPLSDTIWSGSPCVLKISLSSIIVSEAVMVVIVLTSIHLECASITIKDILFKNGPAKSIWMRFHGSSGQSQFCKGDFAGCFACWAHVEHSLTNFSMSASILGH